MIYICDNGLIDIGSHSFNLVDAVLSGFAQLGERVEILAYEGVSSGVCERFKVRPHFKRHLYEGEGGDSITWEVDSWLVLNSSFHADLRALEPELANPAHTLLFPGLTQHQILGLAQWVTSLPERRRPKIVIQLMFSPSWTVWGAVTQLGPLFYRNAGEILRPLVGKSVFLGCENEDMVKLFGDLLGLPIDILPIPTLPLTSGNTRKSGKTLNFAFLGYSKAEKGFHLLPGAIRLAQAAGLPVRFIIQAHHGGWEEETAQAERALRAMGDNVVMLKGAMPPEMYFRVFSMADVVLLPYDPEQYHARGSGVLSEAASYGKPVVATPGTWMAAAAARNECAAVILTSFDSAALFESISATVANFSALSRDAAAKGVIWHDVNNPHNYCAKVMSFGNGGIERPDICSTNDNSQPQLSAKPASEYQLGDLIVIGEGLNWRDYISSDLSNWSAHDLPLGSGGVELVADVKALSDDLELSIELISAKTSQDQQEILVSLNGRWVSTISSATIRAGRALVPLPRAHFKESKTIRLFLRPLWSECGGSGTASASVLLRSFQIRRAGTGAGTTGGIGRPSLSCNKMIKPNLMDCSPLHFESGWSEPEASGRWAVESMAAVVFTPALPFDFSGEAYSLALDVVIPATHPAQTLTVHLNDAVIGVFKVHSSERVCCKLPQSALVNGIPARLAFQTNVTYAVNDDSRPLRIQLQSLTVIAPANHSHLDGPVECYHLGERLEFGDAGSASAFLRAGWSQQERDHCWVGGAEADFVFTTDAKVDSPVLTGEVSIPVEEENFGFEIWVNGKLLERFAAKVGEMCEFSLPLPASAFSIGERTFIRFKASHTFSLPGDPRELSICMHSLLIEDLAKSCSLPASLSATASGSL